MQIGSTSPGSRRSRWAQWTGDGLSGLGRRPVGLELVAVALQEDLGELAAGIDEPGNGGDIERRKLDADC